MQLFALFLVIYTGYCQYFKFKAHHVTIFHQACQFVVNLGDI